MKRIAIGLVCSLICVSLLTSCLSDDEGNKSSDVALLSFSIKDLKTTHTIKKDNGEDSTYTTVVSGKAVKFVVDHAKCRVYNSDSIRFGTDVSHVLVEVKADGGVCYLKPDGSIGEIEDSIDFTQPVTFRVTSYDESFTRDYEVSINVHQVDPKKTVWVQIDGNYPKDLFVEQKAFVNSDNLYVVGMDAEGVYYAASASLTDGADWVVDSCSGIEGVGLEALFMDEVFYLKTDEGTYRSYDAIEWMPVETDAEVNTLPKGSAIAWIKEPLRTNENIVRSIFVAMPEVNDTCARVWTKLNTEDDWVEIVPQGSNIYGCPRLEDLAVIPYAGNMYAFGGQSVGNRKKPLNAFEACYESRDNGVTWKSSEEALSMAEAFVGRTEAYAATTDGEYVWVMWSNGEVWRGRWNGIR